MFMWLVMQSAQQKKLRSLSCVVLELLLVKHGKTSLLKNYHELSNFFHDVIKSQVDVHTIDDRFIE